MRGDSAWSQVADPVRQGGKHRGPSGAAMATVRQQVDPLPETTAERAVVTIAGAGPLLAVAAYLSARVGAGPRLGLPQRAAGVVAVEMRKPVEG